MSPLLGPGRRPGPHVPTSADGVDGLARTLVLPTADDTRAAGERLAGVLRRGDLIVLDGPLGAGKTVMAQGLGAGLGVDGRIASPTFVIARVHAAGRPGGLPLVHVDAYRMGSVAEVDELDLDLDAAAVVTVVEWGAGLVEQLADAHLTISLSRADDDVRTAVLTPSGGDWAERIAALW